MYEYVDEDTETSEVFADLNEFQDYSGLCCGKLADGSDNCYNGER